MVFSEEKRFSDQYPTNLFSLKSSMVWVRVRVRVWVRIRVRDREFGLGLGLGIGGLG